MIDFLDGSFQLGSINQKAPVKRRPRKRKWAHIKKISQIPVVHIQNAVNSFQLPIQWCVFKLMHKQKPILLTKSHGALKRFCTKMSHFFMTHTIFPLSSLTKRRCLLLLLSHRKCLTKIMRTTEVVNICAKFIGQTRIFHVAGWRPWKIESQTETASVQTS